MESCAPSDDSWGIRLQDKEGFSLVAYEMGKTTPPPPSIPPNEVLKDTWTSLDKYDTHYFIRWTTK
jgi:hypothetical protein